MQAVIITTLSFCYDFQTVNTTSTHTYTERHSRKEGRRERDRQTGRQTGIEIVLLTGERFLADSFYVPLSVSVQLHTSAFLSSHSCAWLGL